MSKTTIRFSLEMDLIALERLFNAIKKSDKELFDILVKEFAKQSEIKKLLENDG